MNRTYYLTVLQIIALLCCNCKLGGILPVDPDVVTIFDRQDAAIPQPVSTVLLDSITDVPHCIAVVYDAVSMNATVSWTSCDSVVVQGYVLYRICGDFVERCSESLLTDTFYCDDLTGCTGRAYTYAITTISTAGNQGLPSASPPPFTVESVILPVQQVAVYR
jgi:hypothetical protein